MKIGDAAVALGIAAHVLRHWESLGLLAPTRSSSGHRSYDDQTLDQARMIRTLQRAGLSLDQIRRIARGDNADRAALIDTKRAEIHDRIDLLRAADGFLTHIVTCRHPVLADCPDCSQFLARQYRPALGT
ncbi:MerR family transcriptional regulator [Actinocatenispora sera]|uniref:MerR family transcriptional regulator n=1 Tax=Actinocatenispora sera TaxID=390989 RepID=UPI0033D3FF40